MCEKTSHGALHKCRDGLRGKRGTGNWRNNQSQREGCWPLGSSPTCRNDRGVPGSKLCNTVTNELKTLPFLSRCLPCAKLRSRWSPRVDASLFVRLGGREKERCLHLIPREERGGGSSERPYSQQEVTPPAHSRTEVYVQSPAPAFLLFGDTFFFGFQGP